MLAHWWTSCAGHAGALRRAQQTAPIVEDKSVFACRKPVVIINPSEDDISYGRKESSYFPSFFKLGKRSMKTEEDHAKLPAAAEGGYYVKGTTHQKRSHIHNILCSFLTAAFEMFFGLLLMPVNIIKNQSGDLCLFRLALMIERNAICMPCFFCTWTRWCLFPHSNKMGWCALKKAVNEVLLFHKCLACILDMIRFDQDDDHMWPILQCYP